jgi:5-methylcytosine-specific restriction endonuclease McrA
MRHEVPPEWSKRRAVGLCPVCGKSKAEFQKGLRAFCSPAHRDSYGECFLTWNQMRDRILKRDNHTCALCGFQRGISNRDEKSERLNAEKRKKFEEWLRNPENRQYLDSLREHEIVELDKLYENNLLRIQDDWELVHFVGKWNHNRLIELDLTPQEERDAWPELEIDHKIALTNGGPMWDEKNLWILCEKCHLVKTKQDLNPIDSDSKQTRI